MPSSRLLSFTVVLLTIGIRPEATAASPAYSPTDDEAGHIDIDWSKDRIGLAENPLGKLMLVRQPDFSRLSEAGNQLARLPKGTLVRLGEVVSDPQIQALPWQKVEVITGEFKGMLGWVSGNHAQRIYELRFKTFIPSPVVAIGFEQIMDIPIQLGAVGMIQWGGVLAAAGYLMIWDEFGPYIGPRVFGGDDRSFDYRSERYRSFQSVIVGFARSPKAKMVGGVLIGRQSDDPRLREPERHFGKSTGWRPHKATWVRERPLWWWKLDQPTQPDFGPIQLPVTNENNLITSDWIDENTIRIEFTVDASNPLLKTAPAISAQLTVTMQKNGDEVQARVEGSHDGFPAYELYINGESFYRHDPVARGQSPLSLFGDGSWEWTIDEPWKNVQP